MMATGPQARRARSSGAHGVPTTDGLGWATREPQGAYRTDSYRRLLVVHRLLTRAAALVTALVEGARHSDATVQVRVAPHVPAPPEVHRTQCNHCLQYTRLIPRHTKPVMHRQTGHRNGRT